MTDFEQETITTVPHVSQVTLIFGSFQLGLHLPNEPFQAAFSLRAGS